MLSNDKTKRTISHAIPVEVDRMTEDGDTTMVASMVGVGVEYRLYHDHHPEGDWFLVIPWPEGPMREIQKHLNSVQEVVAFFAPNDGDNKSYWRAWEEAIHYVTKTVGDQILSEMT